MDLLSATGQGANESAVETARQMLDTVKSLGALDQALTGDALQTAVEQFRAFCNGVLEPEPEPEKAKGGKKKKEKKEKKKKKKKAQGADFLDALSKETSGK